MIPVRSTFLGTLAFSVMLLPCFLNGCSGYAARADIEQSKETITSIAIVPPVVHYTSYDRPLFTIKGIEFGGKDDQNDPYLTGATQKNIEEAAGKIIGGSKHKWVACTWPSEQDSSCAPGLQRLLKAVPGTINGISLRGDRSLNVSMGTDCATVGRCAGATHLLIIVADGWSPRTRFENYNTALQLDSVLGSHDIDPVTGLPKAKCKLAMRVMLVEASSGSVIFCSTPAEREVPGSNLEAIKAMLTVLLKPVL